ncbi:hypothetical protein [Desulfobacula sp.]|uniref:hypothetical protein n=1 Tax=Desulfobacula sp. TaxID=2593537 RepID=UPI00261E003B|nr:hypothetical protein [Desulfobacula sp.]
MYIPFHYQVSEYDCVPTAMINAVSYLFHRKEVPPMVIRHIYMYCMDTVSRDARFGIGGTSKLAVRLMGNWLHSYKMKKFSVDTEFLDMERVTLETGGRIHTCLEQGGIVLCNMLLTPQEEHYIMITAIEGEWVYCFDSYLRTSVRGMQGKVKVLKSLDGRAPNLRIKKDWLGRAQIRRFCLGPFHIRESLLIWRNS